MAKAGARTEALFSICRQTEGTFKGWPGDGKTAHSGTQSRLFLTSWWGPKMNSEVSAGVSGLSPLGETSTTGWASPGCAVCLQRELPGDGGRGGTAALWEFGEGVPHPWEPRDPGARRTLWGDSDTRTQGAGDLLVRTSERQLSPMSRDGRSGTFTSDQHSSCATTMSKVISGKNLPDLRASVFSKRGAGLREWWG